MAITVICPGCMTRFQVGDQFAGKKGPCPKCGTIIEIPKEKLVIHAPEDITSGGKQIPGGSTLRPYLQRRFILSLQRMFVALAGIAIIFAVAWLLGRWEACLAKNIVGIAGVFLIGMPLAAYGYMMIRDEDDLEILLGWELYKRAFWTSLGFAALWVLLEYFTAKMSPGPWLLAYLIPIALLGGIIAMIVFDTNYLKALMLFLLVGFSVIALRGFYYAPNGWIWNNSSKVIRALPSGEMKVSGSPAAGSPASPSPATGGSPASPASGTSPAAPTGGSPASGTSPAAGGVKKDPAAAAPQKKKSPVRSSTGQRFDPRQKKAEKK